MFRARPEDFSQYVTLLNGLTLCLLYVELKSVSHTKSDTCVVQRTITDGPQSGIPPSRRQDSVAEMEVDLAFECFRSNTDGIQRADTTGNQWCKC